jgi:hypothetical protein
MCAAALMASETKRKGKARLFTCRRRPSIIDFVIPERRVRRRAAAKLRDNNNLAPRLHTAERLIIKSALPRAKEGVFRGGRQPVPAWDSTDYDSLYVVRLTTSGGNITATFEHDYEGLNNLTTTCP